MADTEACSCPSTTVVRIHGKGTYCGDGQHGRLADALSERLDLDVPDAESGATAALDALRKEPAPVPDDITLLNQAQASIFRALCDARQAPPVWWSPTHGLIEVAHKVSPDDERLVRVADRRVIELPGDAIELRPVDAPAAAQPATVDVGDEPETDGNEFVWNTAERLVTDELAATIAESSKQNTDLDMCGAKHAIMARNIAEDVIVDLLNTGWVAPDGTRVVTAPDTQPAAEPEPFAIEDRAGDTVRVTSLRGPCRIAVDTTDTTWLDPDQADQLADALKAHAAARRAETPGGGETQ